MSSPPPCFQSASHHPIRPHLRCPSFHRETEIVCRRKFLLICKLGSFSQTTRLHYLNAQGEIATLAGWGKLDRFGSIASELRLIKLPIISNEECETRYNRSGSLQFVPENNFLCAGNEEAGRDMCNGDSGGPLVTYRYDGRAQVNLFQQSIVTNIVDLKNHNHSVSLSILN